MANEEHLAILKQGPVAWKQWKKENPDIQPNLTGANLSWVSLEGIDLTGSNLSGAKIGLADLRHGCLRQVNLAGAKLSRADLSGADLREANLRKTDLRGVNLKGTDLRGADLAGADLSGFTELKGAILDENTRLDEKWMLVWEILNETATGRDLRGVDLSRTNLAKANLSRANLSEANLSRANLSEANLDYVDLKWANLYETNLRQSNLYGTNLSEVNLSGADVRWAILREANLSRARFFWANLTRADLSGADMREANLNEAKLFKANLRGADLAKASLVETDFEGADLTGCQVYGISAWDLNLVETIQNDLVITPPGLSTITVDGIEIAQFIYLLLHNAKLHNIVDVIGQKGVLILGLFPKERKVVLDAFRDELRRRDYLPLTLEFDKINGHNLTETAITLAQMSRFVIVDITDTSGITNALPEVVGRLPTSPVYPIILESQYQSGMFQGISQYHWVLAPHCYHNREQLIEDLGEKIIKPAEIKAQEISKRRQQIEAYLTRSDLSALTSGA